MKRRKTQSFWTYSYILFCILFILFPLSSLSCAETAVKSQKVTVGMYNTYARGDGNLGRSDPDLKEVWRGSPEASDFEACNMTMHYWPWPKTLPKVRPGRNPYSAWWINYMEEAYKATNQNGKVRLRVIVGPLYEYYRAYRGKVFDGFIEDLCRWEKDSIYTGTLGGWYIVEEPMGSNHNYKPGICNEMADAIKAVEKSVGVPHHAIYVDISIDGKYFKPSALAEFTRQADVVMISASTYLWSARGDRPVYEPRWKDIHGVMKKVRDIVYADRDRRKLPRPQVHVVLEARDAMGYGQPTDWEMRQQIHTALTHSNQYNDPPADGIWFFWWSEIGRHARYGVDDWNRGRHLAEVIQTQVALSTSAAETQKNGQTIPKKTQFKFPQTSPFKAKYSCIPYDLAEAGHVEVQILKEDKSSLERFDMRYQVAGRLGKFGGPYWEKDRNRDGYYIFRLYLNSKLMDEAKVMVQWR